MRDNPFDFSAAAISAEECSGGTELTQSATPNLNIIPATPLTVRKECGVNNKTGTSTESPGLQTESVPKKMMATRTSSLPLNAFPEEITAKSIIKDKRKCKSHNNFLETGNTDTNTDVQIDSDHVKTIDTENEPKQHRRRQKYSIKKFKQRLKRNKKQDKSGDRNHKNMGEGSESEIQSEADSISHDERSQGSRSENEEYPLSDDEPIDDSFIPEKRGGFFRRMSVKVKQLVTHHDDEDEFEVDKKAKKKESLVTVNDLTEDNNNSKAVFYKITVKDLLLSPSQGR